MACVMSSQDASKLWGLRFWWSDMGIAGIVFIQAFAQCLGAGPTHVDRQLTHKSEYDTVAFRKLLLVAELVKKNPGRPRSAASHNAIMTATLQLLGEVGFDAMSIEAVSSRAKVSKNTIYRWYRSKADIVADAIESVREEISIPNTGSLQGDLDVIIDNAARITLSALGRKAVAMIVSSAAGNAEFANLYWEKYLQPRRQAFKVVVERAAIRGELPKDLDSVLVFDVMSGIMLYTLLFETSADRWKDRVRCAVMNALRKS
jgi:AcrR family transcriptional regulator